MFNNQDNTPTKELKPINNSNRFVNAIALGLALVVGLACSTMLQNLVAASDLSKLVSETIRLTVSASSAWLYQLNLTKTMINAQETRIFQFMHYIFSLLSFITVLVVGLYYCSRPIAYFWQTIKVMPTLFNTKRCLFCNYFANCSLVFHPSTFKHFVVAYDVNPQKPTHLLIIAKRHVVKFTNLLPYEYSELLACIKATVSHLALVEFTIKNNNGPSCDQTIPHLHVHILGYTRDQKHFKLTL